MSYLGTTPKTFSSVMAFFNCGDETRFRRTATGGLKLKGMPTKFEREGNRYAMRAVDPTIEVQGEVKSEKTLWQQAVEWENSVVTKEAADYGAVIVEAEQYKELSLTNLFMSVFPDCRFREYLKRRIPSSKAVDLYATWGYDMKHLPPSGMGAAYSDVYNAKLWLKDQPIKLPIVASSIAYNCMITRDSITGNRLASENDRRADRRDFEAGFVKDKRLAQDFYNAGAIKAQKGDNHVAFLMQAISKILSIKQADEAESICSVMVDRDIFRNLIEVNMEPRDSTSAAIAKALSEPWVKDQGREIHELVLPSAAANAEEVIVLLYLMGALDNKESFYQRKATDEKLTVKPYFGCISTGVSSLLRIPLVNAHHIIDIQPYLGKKFDIELGTLEETLTSYVKRFGLHDQVNVAKNLICTAVVSNPLGVSVEQLVAVPKPSHACEYDLWQRSSTRENTTFITFTVYEDANLLAALLQIQGDVMRQVVCIQGLQHLTQMKTPMLSGPGKTNYEKWVTTTFNKGPRQLLSGWCSGILGVASVEVESLITNNLQAFSDLLWRTYRSEPMKVSAQIWGGIKPTLGAAGLIWDKTRRDKEAERSFVDSQVGGVLQSLYNNSHDCYDARGPQMLLLCGPTTQIRGLKRDVVASGQRNILNLRGEPKLLFFGTKPTSEALKSRLSDAGTALNLTSHYEPTFDLDSASSLLLTQLTLAQLEDDKEKEAHSKEPKVSGSTVEPDYIPYNYVLPELSDKSTWQYPGRPYVAGPFAGGSYQSHVAEALASESRHESKEKWTKVSSRAGWSTGVGGRVAYNSRNAKTNGLSNTLKKLSSERQHRLEEAKKTQSKPLALVGSEVVDPNSIEVTKRAEAIYSQSSMEEEVYSGFTAGMSRAMNQCFEEMDVAGDGRCGIRSLHQSMRLANDVRELKLLMRMEAEMFGSNSLRLPRATHVDDGAMAVMADSFGYDLLVVEQRDPLGQSIDTIRFHKNDSHNDRKVLFVKIVGNHWISLKDLVNKEFTDMDEFIETRREYMMSQKKVNETTDYEVDTTPRTQPGGMVYPSAQVPPSTGKKNQRNCRMSKKIRRVIKENGGRVGPTAITYSEIGSSGSRVGNALPKGQMWLATPRNIWHFCHKRAIESGEKYGDFESYKWWCGEQVSMMKKMALPIGMKCGFNAPEVSEWLDTEVDDITIQMIASFTGQGLGVISTERRQGPNSDVLLCTKVAHKRGAEDFAPISPIYEINGTKYVGDAYDQMSATIRGVGGLLERALYFTRDIEPVEPNGAENGVQKALDRGMFEDEEANRLSLRIEERLIAIKGHIHKEEFMCPGLERYIHQAHMGTPSDTRGLFSTIAGGFALVGRPADAKWMLHSAHQWVEDVIGVGAAEMPVLEPMLAQLLVLHRGGRAWYSDDNFARKGDGLFKIEDWHTPATGDTLPIILGRNAPEQWRVYEISAPLRAFYGLRSLHQWCKETEKLPPAHTEPMPGPVMPPSKSTGSMRTNDTRQWELMGFLTGAGALVVIGGLTYGTTRTLYRHNFNFRNVFASMYRQILVSTHSLSSEVANWRRRWGEGAHWHDYSRIPYNAPHENDAEQVHNVMSTFEPRERENSYRSWYSLGSWSSFWSVDLGSDAHDEI